MINLCTLFDSKYLDKGICLYNSLLRHTENFTLYVVCFDDISQRVLEDMQLHRMVVINERECHTERLLKIKEERSRAEYCWTCTSVIIEYILDHYDIEDCTYIDSDLYFYCDPQILFDEIKGSGCHAAISPHRFPEGRKYRRMEKRYGRYCVQFNYFDQSQEGRKLLTWWKEKCLEWCYCKVESDRYGDQKYLDFFGKVSGSVHEMKNEGCGVAHWNLSKYDLGRTDGSRIELISKESGDVFPIVFFHFQDMRFLDGERVNLFSGTRSEELKRAVYYPYIREIVKIRRMLFDKGIIFDNSIVKSKDLCKVVYQKYIYPYRHRCDIVQLKDIIGG